MQDQGFKWIIVSDVAELTAFNNILGLGHPLSLDDLFQKISDEVDTEFQAHWEENAARGLIEDDMPHKGAMEKAKRRSALVQELALSSNGEATYYTLIPPKAVVELKAALRSLLLTQTSKLKAVQSAGYNAKAPEATWFLARGVAVIIEGDVDILRKAEGVWGHLPRAFQLMEPKELDDSRAYACQSVGPTGFTTWISQDIDSIHLVVEEGPTVKLVSYSPTNAFSEEAVLGEVQRLYEGRPVELHEAFEDIQFDASKYDPVKEIV
jgi:hypothetical protein